MFKTSNTGKIFATAAATNLIANKGSPSGCLLLSFLLLSTLAISPFILILWLILKIFN